MFSLWKNGEGAANVAPATVEAVVVETAAATPEPEYVERSILRDCSAALDAARQRVTALTQEVDRLGAVINEGAKVAATLQADIAADGAASIMALVKGEAPNGAMTSLVAIELAARAAQARLPVATAALDEAKAAAMRAEVEVMRAARNLLLVEAGKRGAEYRKHFDELARLHDELIGISYGLPPTETLGQEIHNTVVGFEIPAFNLGGAYSATMRHGPDERRVAQTTARWSAASAALRDDPDADVAKRIFNSDGPSVGRKSLILLDRAGDFVKL